MFPVLALAVSVAPPVAERTIPVAAFHALRLEAVATVHVSVSNESKVVLKGDPRTIACIAAKADGGTLLIDWRKRPPRETAGTEGSAEVVVFGLKGCRRASGPGDVQISVETPSLDRAVLAASNGNIMLDPMSGPGLDAAIPGRGAIAIQGLRSRMTRLAIGGHGRITITGQPGHVSASIAGSGTIDSTHAAASALDILIAGHGQIVANVDGPASGTIAGTGTVTVHGRPVCIIHKAGKGKIECPA
jgi:hypothetical protein